MRCSARLAASPVGRSSTNSVKEHTLPTQNVQVPFKDTIVTEQRQHRQNKLRQSYNFPVGNADAKTTTRFLQRKGDLCNHSSITAHARSVSNFYFRDTYSSCVPSTTSLTDFKKRNVLRRLRSLDEQHTMWKSVIPVETVPTSAGKHWSIRPKRKCTFTVLVKPYCTKHPATVSTSNDFPMLCATHFLVKHVDVLFLSARHLRGGSRFCR